MSLGKSISAIPVDVDSLALCQSQNLCGIGLDCYTKGLGIASDSIYDIKRAQLYNNIAVLYHLSSHLDKAEHYYLKALDINLRRDIRAEIFLNYNNLAELYDKLGRIPDALDASLRGLQYVDANKQPEYFYGTHIFLGNLYTRTGDLDMAASYLSNGTSKLKDINFVPGLVDAYQAYSRYFMVRGKSCNEKGPTEKSHSATPCF